MADSTHYVTRIVIQKVVKEEFQSSAGRAQGTPVEVRRNVTDIANIVVSSGSLETLNAKISAHVALVDSDEEIS